jgi:hypothetical protein
MRNKRGAREASRTHHCRFFHACIQIHPLDIVLDSQLSERHIAPVAAGELGIREPVRRRVVD